MEHQPARRAQGDHRVASAPALSVDLCLLCSYLLHVLHAEENAFKNILPKKALKILKIFIFLESQEQQTLRCS